MIRHDSDEGKIRLSRVHVNFEKLPTINVRSDKRVCDIMCDALSNDSALNACEHVCVCVWSKCNFHSFQQWSVELIRKCFTPNWPNKKLIQISHWCASYILYREHFIFDLAEICRFRWNEKYATDWFMFPMNLIVRRRMITAETGWLQWIQGFVCVCVLGKKCIKSH